LVAVRARVSGNGFAIHARREKSIS
jgi:hypothetical protein